MDNGRCPDTDIYVLHTDVQNLRTYQGSLFSVELASGGDVSRIQIDL